MRWNVCRICLAANVKTILSNTELLDIYTKLTSNQWNRDQRPDTICHICLAFLKRCYKLREMSKKTELVFAQFFSCDFEFTKETAPMLTKRKQHQLFVSPVQTFTLGNTSDDGEEITLQEKTSFVMIDIKQEKNEESSCLELKNSCNQSPEREDGSENRTSTHQSDNGEAFLPTDNDEQHSDTLESKTHAKPLLTKVKEMIEGATENNGLNDSQMSINNKSFTLKFNLSDRNGTMQNKRKSTFPLIKPKSSKTQLTCTLCDESFEEEYFLNNHMKDHKKTLVCVVCNKTFSREIYLERHKRIHERPHACDQCPKSFEYSKHLQTHLIIHSKIKPYVCKICDKGFSQLSNLQQHKRIHTGETPYSCNVCGKKFKQQSNLLQHSRTHTKEKPYSCNFCSKAFAQLSNLKQHTQVYHDEEKH